MPGGQPGGQFWAWLEEPGPAAGGEGLSVCRHQDGVDGGGAGNTTPGVGSDLIVLWGSSLLDAFWCYLTLPYCQASFRQSLPVVTLYTNLGEEAVIHGLEETEAELIITSHELLPK